MREGMMLAHGDPSSFRFIGWFAKRIARATPEMALPGVSEIWSASHCISSAPLDWIQHWRHNDFGLFDTPELARSVVPAGEADAYRIVGYRLASPAFGDGPALRGLSSTAPTLDMPADLVTLGFDAVSSSHGEGFECSPLSCNGAAKELAVTERCLFAAASDAADAARAFAAGRWEPGPYYVVEVLVPRS